MQVRRPPRPPRSGKSLDHSSRAIIAIFGREKKIGDDLATVLLRYDQEAR
jgi:hypothetical protein